jgi:hypothetical protein
MLGTSTSSVTALLLLSLLKKLDKLRDRIGLTHQITATPHLRQKKHFVHKKEQIHFFYPLIKRTFAEI